MRLSMRPTLLAGLVAVLALPASGEARSSGFCSHYRQIESNAGACPSCRLAIAPTEKYYQFRVTANNGWVADVQLEGDGTASGSGKWQAGNGTYAGQKFKADFSVMGKSMDMVMSLKNATIRGEFQCMDK